MKLPDSIHIEFIDHQSQRYNTAGDYAQDGDNWTIWISKTATPQHALMVLMHELTEMILTQNDGVAWSDIDHWDMEGGGKDSDDPGALPEAPYFLQHARATIIEKALALFMGIDFDEYDEALGELTWQ